MNATYTGLELRRVLRDYTSLFFIAVLPAFFYVIFGASQDWSGQQAGNGKAHRPQRICPVCADRDHRQPNDAGENR